MVKKSIFLVFVISSCTVLTPSLPSVEEACYEEDDEQLSPNQCNASNFTPGPNHPDAKKIERKTFINKIEKLETACVNALRKSPHREKEIKEVFIQKYAVLKKEYSEYLTPLDQKQYHQEAVWSNIQNTFLHPEEPKEMLEMKNDTCCIMQ